MLGLFSSLTSSVPIGKKLHEPATEGTINRLHYRVTVLIFLGCSLIVTCLEWVGNGSKISCVMEGPVDSWTIPQNVINTYCYVLTTFTIPKHWNTKIGHDSAQIGVGHYNPKNDDVTYKAYYQWVPFVLFLQVSKMSFKSRVDDILSDGLVNFRFLRGKEQIFYKFLVACLVIYHSSVAPSHRQNS